jgi:hypothetical protein
MIKQGMKKNNNERYKSYVVIGFKNSRKEYLGGEYSIFAFQAIRYIP